MAAQLSFATLARESSPRLKVLKGSGVYTRIYTFDGLVFLFCSRFIEGLTQYMYIFVLHNMTVIPLYSLLLNYSTANNCTIVHTDALDFISVYNRSTFITHQSSAIYVVIGGMRESHTALIYIDIHCTRNYSELHRHSLTQLSPQSICI